MKRRRNAWETVRSETLNPILASSSRPDGILARHRADTLHDLEEAKIACVVVLDEHETAPLTDLQRALELFVNTLNGCFSRHLDAADPGALSKRLAATRLTVQEEAAKFRDLEQRGKNVLMPIARLRAKRR